jgi:hypothetical protein
MASLTLLDFVHCPAPSRACDLLTTLKFLAVILELRLSIVRWFFEK